MGRRSREKRIRRRAQQLAGVEWGMWGLGDQADELDELDLAALLDVACADAACDGGGPWLELLDFKGHREINGHRQGDEQGQCAHWPAEVESGQHVPLDFGPAG